MYSEPVSGHRQSFIIGSADVNPVVAASAPRCPIYSLSCRRSFAWLAAEPKHTEGHAMDAPVSTRKFQVFNGEDRSSGRQATSGADALRRITEGLEGSGGRPRVHQALYRPAILNRAACQGHHGAGMEAA